MIVQIYEVGSPDEAAELASIGVDHIGVLVGPGEFPREIGVPDCDRIFAAVPKSSRRVALSLAHDVEAISAIVERTNPDILHLGTTPELLGVDRVAELKSRFPRVEMMRTVPVVDETSITVARQYDGIADWLLLDTQDPTEPVIGATGRTHDWTLSRAIVEAVGIPVILAGGLGPDNVVEAIRSVRPAGVDSKTKTDRRGEHGKDPARVREFVTICRRPSSSAP